MYDDPPLYKDDKHIARERTKAKELRKTQWWQNKLHEGVCHYCGKKFPRDELTMDHIVALSRGGRSTKGNIVVACHQCNQDKKHLTPIEMLWRKLEAQKKKAEES